jgi:RNA recognition motif-containing protein
LTKRRYNAGISELFSVSCLRYSCPKAIISEGVLQATHKNLERGKMNIYVGNLSFDAAEEDLKQLFAAFGQVTSVNIIKDQFTGRSRGFAFVEMGNADEAKAAIAGVAGKDFKGRTLNVSEARPRGESGAGGGGNRFNNNRRGSGGDQRRRNW